MPLQNLPSEFRSYAAEQRAITVGAVAEVRRQWRAMGEDFDRSWRRVGPAIQTVTAATQYRLAQNAGEAIPDIAAAAVTRPPAPAGRVNPAALVGVAGDGRSVEGLMRGAVVGAKSAVAGGASTRQALLAGLSWLTMATATLMGDTIRAAEFTGMASVRTSRYVRVVQAGACSRCAILAGKTETGEFWRHPGCLCQMLPVADIPSRELEEQGIFNSPEGYFHSLTEAEQNRIFTKAGAEAIRHGADPIQVVNARRGMLRAQSGRIKATKDGAYITFEGTGRRGWAARNMRPHVPEGRKGAARLMPESIVNIAQGDPERMVELLRKFGYLY